jgi:predicted GIY-YIG superfamily endonuclease
MKLKHIIYIIVDYMFYCYLLYTDQGHTYVGATTHVDRRLKQHNKEQSGGAKATGIRVSQGMKWKRACYITNIPEWSSALQIEWKWKQLGRTSCKTIKNPIQRRLHSLRELLLLEKPTKMAIPYDAYPEGPPIIVWDSDEIKEQYESILYTDAKSG